MFLNLFQVFGVFCSLVFINEMVLSYLFTNFAKTSQKALTLNGRNGLISYKKYILGHPPWRAQNVISHARKNAQKSPM